MKKGIKGDAYKRMNQALKPLKFFDKLILKGNYDL